MPTLLAPNLNIWILICGDPLKTLSHIKLQYVLVEKNLSIKGKKQKSSVQEKGFVKSHKWSNVQPNLSYHKLKVSKVDLLTEVFHKNFCPILRTSCSYSHWGSAINANNPWLMVCHLIYDNYHKFSHWYAQ